MVAVVHRASSWTVWFRCYRSSDHLHEISRSSSFEKKAFGEMSNHQRLVGMRGSVEEEAVVGMKAGRVSRIVVWLELLIGGSLEGFQNENTFFSFLKFPGRPPVREKLC